MRLFAGIVGMALGCCWSAGLWAQNAEAEWQRGFHLQLPALSRSVTLSPGVDAAQWSRRAGLPRTQISRLGQAGTVVTFEADDLTWSALQPRLCQQSQVIACESTSCQQIQLGGRVAPGPGIQSFKPRLRLLRKAPSLERYLLGGSGVSGADSGGASCPPPTDLRGEPALLTRAEGSVEYQLDNSQLPEDPQCWELVIESACHLSRTPLDSLLPAREMRRVLALLPGGTTLTGAALAARYGLRVLREADLSLLNEKLVVLELPVGTSLDGMLGRLRQDGDISEALPEHIFTTSAVYSDPFAALAYGPERMGAPRLHRKVTGKGVRVAVIDTGVDHQHAELTGRVMETVDVTGRGWGADLHGTAIAGIIAAGADNLVGSYGVAPEAELLTVKACHPVETGKSAAHCWTSTLVQALDVAVQKGVPIINMSLGGPPDKLLARYVKAAHKRGHLIIAAAGNGGAVAKPAFPAALEEVVAVTAVDAANHLYAHATTGDFVELAAPGVDIVSVAPGGNFPALSGTSIASAHISGLAALLLQLSPQMSVEELRTGLQEAATDLGEPGPDELFGLGVVDGCTAAGMVAGAAVCGGQ